MENPRVTSFSTDEIYKSNVAVYNDIYAETRKELDYKYHSHYTIERQIVQDKIITELLSVGRTMEYPWLIYNFGVVGAGKTYTIRKFSEINIFPILAFVVIDYDRIKCMLPDMKKFIEQDPDSASKRVHREASLISEIAERQAIKMKKCILIDGGLREIDWYRYRLQSFVMNSYHYSLGLIHVVAEPELIYKRIVNRVKHSDRNINLKSIENQIEDLPDYVDYLSAYAHLTITIENNDENDIPKIVKPKLRVQDLHRNEWFHDRFKYIWKQLEDNKKDGDKEELKVRINKFGSIECSINF
jgi:hypothetical protein